MFFSRLKLHRNNGNEMSNGEKNYFSLNSSWKQKGRSVDTLTSTESHDAIPADSEASINEMNTEMKHIDLGNNVFLTIKETRSYDYEKIDSPTKRERDRDAVRKRIATNSHGLIIHYTRAHRLSVLFVFLVKNDIRENFKRKTSRRFRSLLLRSSVWPHKYGRRTFSSLQHPDNSLNSTVTISLSSNDANRRNKIAPKSEHVPQHEPLSQCVFTKVQKVGFRSSEC